MKPIVPEVKQANNEEVRDGLGMHSGVFCYFIVFLFDAMQPTCIALLLLRGRDRCLSDGCRRFLSLGLTYLATPGEGVRKFCLGASWCLLPIVGPVSDLGALLDAVWTLQSCCKALTLTMKTTFLYLFHLFLTASYSILLLQSLTSLLISYSSVCSVHDKASSKFQKQRCAVSSSVEAKLPAVCPLPKGLL